MICAFLVHVLFRAASAATYNCMQLRTIAFKKPNKHMHELARLDTTFTPRMKGMPQAAHHGLKCQPHEINNEMWQQ
jgi:hypothetical protein